MRLGMGKGGMKIRRREDGSYDINVNEVEMNFIGAALEKATETDCEKCDFNEACRNLSEGTGKDLCGETWRMAYDWGKIKNEN